MTPRIAAAPCSYGVFEITVDNADLPDGRRSPRRWPPRGTRAPSSGRPATSARAGRWPSCSPRNGLALCGSFLPLRFSRREGFAEDLRGDGGRAHGARGGERGRGVSGRAALRRLLRAGPHAARRGDRGAPGDVARRAAPAPADRQRAARGAALPRARLPGVVPPARRHVRRDAARGRRRARGDGHGACSACASTRALRRSAAATRSPPARRAALVNHVHLKDVDLGLLARMHARAAGSRTRGTPACSASSAPAARMSRSASTSSGARLRRLDRRRAGSGARAGRVVHRRARLGGAQPRVAARAWPLTRATRTRGSRRRRPWRLRPGPSRSGGRTRPCARGRCPAASRR